MSEIEFDREAVRAKYREERDRRLRPDGTKQYLNLVGDFSRYLEDPNADEVVDRVPCTDETDVVVIGGGFAGLLAGARLRQQGVEDIRLVEKGADVGGTWYWNRYPGAQCDVESYIYLPLLEELGYVPTEKYAHAPEILSHSRAIAEKYRLYDGALLQTEVTELRWDEATRRWLVRTDRGDELRSRFVVWGCGALHRAKLPGLPGINDFKGHSFHSSRWDYGYTGGDNTGGLVGLQDKVVGVIGTGASGVQIVPHVGAWAKQLYVFQRTPSAVHVRGNRATDPNWAESLQPGWQRRRMQNFANLMTGIPDPEDLVDDGWTAGFKEIVARAAQVGSEGLAPEVIADMMEEADFVRMEQVRQRVGSTVVDPATAEALKPYYAGHCKRPCFHDEYLDTFNHPNVTLVDSHGKGVQRVTERGVVVNNVEYELDCLIWATGFEIATSVTQKAGNEVYGRGGLTLTDAWTPTPQTLHGCLSRGFPNLLFIAYAGGAFSVNFPQAIDLLATQSAWIIANALRDGITVVEAGQQAQDEWVATCAESQQGMEPDAGCTPSYQNNEGQPHREPQHIYGGGPQKFGEILRNWRTAGDFHGVELTRD